MLLGGVGREIGAIGSADERGFGAHLADLVEAGVARDLIHPGAECCARAKGLAIAQDAEENFLDEVFADGAVLRHFGVEVEERGLIAVEQHAQHLHFTVAYLEHHVLVGNRVHSVSVISALPFC